MTISVERWIYRAPHLTISEVPSLYNIFRNVVIMLCFFILFLKLFFLYGVRQEQVSFLYDYPVGPAPFTEKLCPPTVSSVLLFYRSSVCTLLCFCSVSFICSSAGTICLNYYIFLINLIDSNFIGSKRILPTCREAEF